MILLAEDEPVLREAEAAYLRNAGFKVIEASSGKDAIEIFETQSIELIVLDINLPELDGLEVTKHIRAQSQVPIIMVTARKRDLDELIGFEYGADDYLKKPFNPHVLLARVKSLLKHNTESELHAPPFILNPEKLTLVKGSEQIELTVMQFSLLYRLMERPGVILTREQLITAAHETYDTDIFDRTIDAHVKALRQKIEEDPSKPQFIQTVYGRGYRFIGINHA